MASIRRKLLIRSLYFAVIEALQAAGDWKQAGAILNREAKALERGGAEFIILATNTMHKLAAEMMHGVSIPLLHIADATARSIKAKGLRSPGLMATRFTMEENLLHRTADRSGSRADRSGRCRPHRNTSNHL